MSETVGAVGERGLLARIRARVPGPPAGVTIGIGDDAAVLAPAGRTHAVVTVDSLVERIHFDRRWSSPADVGHKALAVNLSDLAAMGASPEWALLSLAMPGDWPVAEFDGVLDGLLALAAAHGVAVIGGNLARTDGPLVVNVTCGGACRPRRVLLRSGGRPGDDLYVSGTLGAAAAGLEMLQAGHDAAGADEAACVARHRRPDPRVRLGVAIGRARAARAAMDLSDGLADAVRQVAEASGTGASIDAAAVPVAPGARRWFASRGEDAVSRTLAGGEDYELLLAVPPKWRGRLRNARRHAAEPGLTRIGTLTKDRALVVRRADGEGPLPDGFEHFRRDG
ncbi:MAG: thiamine-phosphate kinase [Vicinamibacterales bacterium]|nr:thiamine-phosphate kinase [Vicinamibacterales bacterium]